MNPLRKAFIRTIENTEATYVMTSAFRVLNNHALEELLTYQKKHIIIYKIPEENPRNNQYFEHYVPSLVETLEHIADTVTVVKDKDKIPNYIRGNVIMDKGYLREEREIEELVSNNTDQGFITIESNVLVPVQIASIKEEYSAKTIRPKIWKLVSKFLDPCLEDKQFSQGELDALETLEEFVEHKLDLYDHRSHPEVNYSSNLSIFLKYGFISPLTIYNRLETETHPNVELFLEELIIRRELAYNFVYYNKYYDQFEYMTYEWAYETMDKHLGDEREYIYSIMDYITFQTHDKYFNAAMEEMVTLGKMHNYMRMYWCKKIIEWSPSYKEAFEIALYLNNYYFFDGNTPNGYAGVAWCFGKHDRAWTERKIFGKLRYMNANGLKRKFEIDEYIRRIEKEVMEYELSETKDYD